MEKGDSLLQALAAEFACAADQSMLPALSLAVPAALHARARQHQLSGRESSVF